MQSSTEMMKSVTRPVVAAFLLLSTDCQSTARQTTTGAAAETELRQLAVDWDNLFN
jgi:hypothetical protein